MTEADLFIGKQIGNYIIRRALGAGAMGAIYLAEHPEIGRKMAIKLLAPHLAQEPSMKDRFLSEAQSVARISHPHVVEIYDFGEFEGRLYYLMELLEGQELKQLIARRGTFSVQEIYPLLSQICSALQAAHEHGIVHRDLKPENIFVLSQEPLFIKLLDFSIAKVSDLAQAMAYQTLDGAVLGTPLYMAPEQAAGLSHEVCPQTDIYALGVILFQLLAGRPPFEGETPMILMVKHIRDDPPSLKALAPSTPEAVVRLVERCLHKKPEIRPRSVTVLMQEFAQAIRGAAEMTIPPAPGSSAEPTTRPPLPKVAADVVPLAIRGTLLERKVENSDRELQHDEASRPAQAAAGPVGHLEHHGVATPPVAIEEHKAVIEHEEQQNGQEPSVTTSEQMTSGETVTISVPETSVAHKEQQKEAKVPDASTRHDGAAEPEKPTEPTTAAEASAAPAEQQNEPRAAATTSPTKQPAAMTTSTSDGMAAAAGDGAAAAAGDETTAAAAGDGTAAAAGDKTTAAAGDKKAEKEEETLKSLLHWMQKKGDFPAISKSISEISLKTLPTSRASAPQLAEEIMKDLGLTTKLLRLVNSAYYDRGRGRINTISRAVVFLGFEQVRMAALGLTLFKNIKGKNNATDLLDNAIHSLMSGDLAKRLAQQLGIEQPEEAFICAMFRNIGQHMVQYYLPEEYAAIQRLCQEKGLSEERATHSVLGLSFSKIGEGLAKHWRLSERLLTSMKPLPAGKVERPRTPAQQLQVLSSYAAELCQVISSVPSERQAQAFIQLAQRYKLAVPIKEKELRRILISSTQSFSERYAQLLDFSMRQSPLLKKAQQWADRNKLALTKHKPLQALGQRSGGQESPADPNNISTAEEIPLTLPPMDDEQQQQLRANIAEINRLIMKGDSTTAVIQKILQTFYEGFRFHRVLLCIAQLDQPCLQVRAGLGSGVEHLIQELSMPLSPTGEDVFSRAFYQQTDCVVEDAQAAEMHRQVPRWFHEGLDAPAFMLCPLIIAMRSIGLIYLDRERQGQLVLDEQLPFINKLRNQTILAFKQNR